MTCIVEREDAGTWACGSETSTASREGCSGTYPNAVICWASFSAYDYWEEPAVATSFWWRKISAVSGTFTYKL